MKKVYLFLLALLVLFMSCEQPTDPIVEDDDPTVTTDPDPDPVPVDTVTSDDGMFTLTNSTVAFNSETSVSLFDLGLGADFETSNFYAPINLDRLENGTTDPVISFTFDEALYASTMEGVFSISSWSGTIAPVPQTSDAKTNVFYDMASGPITAKSVAISDATVSFTFEAGTFSADDTITVVFGIKKATGEVYQVFTAFQPLADVTSSVTITSDFSNYYAYAVDSTEVYYLNSGFAGDHINPTTQAQTIYNVTPAAGSDFGNLINSASTRYSNVTTGADFFHLNNLTNRTSSYLLDHTLATHASSYNYYIEEADGTLNLLSAGTDYTVSNIVDVDSNIIGKTVNLDISVQTIEAGDTFVVAPVNSRGEFYQYAAEYLLTDTVSPFGIAGNITTSANTTISWAGQDWSTHDEAAASEGEIVQFSSFDITTLTGWSANEGIEIILNSVSLTVSDTTSSGIGSTRILTEAEVRAEYDIPSEVTLFSSDSGRIWAGLEGTSVNVVVGFECNDGNGINYLPTNWEVVGTLNISITDLSGNVFMYTDNTVTTHSDGLMTVTLQ